MDETYVPPNYCSSGWSLYGNVADMWRNFDKAFPGRGVPFPETLNPEQAAAQQAVKEANDRVYEHLDTCPRCYAEECRVMKYFGQEDTIN
jgi:hypothetical protein